MLASMIFPSSISTVGAPEIQLLILRFFRARTDRRKEVAVITTRANTKYEAFRLTLNARFAATEPSVILVTKS
ncbi:hypothetical protein D3C72_2181830 [compost metagenome]